MTRCRSCHARIRWAHTENGRRIPLDAVPFAGDDPGHLYVLREQGEIAVAITPDAAGDEIVFRSHFRTCPDADRWGHRG